MAKLTEDRTTIFGARARPTAGGELLLELDGLPVVLEQVRDRRPPPGMLLLSLLLLLALVVGFGWLGVSSFDEVEGTTSRAVAADRIRLARRALEKVPTANADPALAPIAPVKLLDLNRDEARILNLSIPFSKAPNPAASPFVTGLRGVDALRAMDCLAAAVWYEAGDDAIGERAVAQVVLNRVRHPAFPKSVCGVVFQGSERQTGCQFSFTCDGAMRRKPSQAAWDRARQIATGAMAGLVFSPVGYATHYHTDWVAPYWSAKVDKIAQIGTHLFFRWTGSAGRAGAFTGRVTGQEPSIAPLASLSPAHVEGGDAIAEAAESDARQEAGIAALAAARLNYGGVGPDAHMGDVPQLPQSILRGNHLKSYDEGANAYVVTLAPKAPAGSLALMALDLCARVPGKPCRVHGRVSDNVTGVEDDFSYARDRARNYESVQWNCQRFPRADKNQCNAGSTVP